MDKTSSVCMLVPAQLVTAPTCNFLRVNAQMQGWTIAKNYK